MADGELCGTQPCMQVVNHLGEVLRQQQVAGFTGIEKLMQAHHDELKEDVAQIRAAIKDQGDEIFPRLRSVEERIAIMERTSIAEKTVKKMIQEGIGDNETIIAVNRTRKWMNALAVTVAGSIVIKAVFWIAGLFKFAPIEGK